LRLLRVRTSATVLPSGDCCCATAQAPPNSSTISPTAQRVAPRVGAIIGNPPPLLIRAEGNRHWLGECQGGVSWDRACPATWAWPRRVSFHLTHPLLRFT